jgi:hypothetical protein
MKTTIDMAREVYGAHTEWKGAPLDRLEQLVALARADEREQAAAQRQWVGLTDEERTEIRREHYARTLPLMDAVEAKLKEKNA